VQTESFLFIARSCAGGYVDDRAEPERLRFPRFHAESGEMLGFAHIPTGTRKQPRFLKNLHSGKGRGGKINASRP
jgi:hypothetical protein